MVIWVECPRGNMFAPEAIYIYKEKIVFLCDWKNCPENEDCLERDGRTIALNDLKRTLREHGVELG